MGKSEKTGKKITKLKWPKYQKTKDENMGWTKYYKTWFCDSDLEKIYGFLWSNCN